MSLLIYEAFHPQFKQLHALVTIITNIFKEQQNFTARWNNLPV